jgi:hypothetical protein
MPNIVHRIGSEKAAPADIYKRISTVEGIASWWTTQVGGETRVGRILQFRFGERGSDFEVLEMVPNKRVVWKCLSGPAEWIDTRIEFEIEKSGNESILLFKHSGWRAEIEFMHHCSTQWGYFLVGLKDAVENDQGTPFGDEKFRPISSWSK